ncbi:MAG TPA: tetratricopeptide repeat protein [Syntrophorhabdaceae bacterium]|nr:tetratricopeptide repeat protein [Syntrophorhabdaceae bacterium]
MKYLVIVFLVCAVVVSAGCSGSESDGMTAQEYYKKAYQFIDAGYPVEAIELLDLAIKKDPGYFEAYYNRGVVYYLMKNYKAAIWDLSKAISINPKSSEAYASRGEVYEMMKESEKAYSDYRTAARMGNKGAQKYLKLKNVSW